MNNRALIGILCLALAAVSANGCKKAGTTLDNLKAAIVGETTASAKYAAYAQKAREEKFEAIAMLFQAASKAEAIHANKHTEVLGAMGIREVRRLRGETGRAIFMEDMEREAFGDLIRT